MAPSNKYRRRRRATTRRRPRSSRGQALWVALLLGGVLVVVVATITLISASSARTQARVAEQRYFAPTSASVPPVPSVPSVPPVLPVIPSDRTPDPSRPTAKAESTPRTSLGRRSAHPTVAGRSTAPAGQSQQTLPSIAHPAAASPSVPTSIVLAGSGNPIRVVPIGVSAAGVLEPPEDISTAGWWVSGPRPGTPGRAVITGHIDSTAGLGAFAALDLLHDGDTIALGEANGRTLHFKVTARQQIEKTQLDPRLLQHTGNASDLLLVTCIGNFDDSTRSYDSNLLITAVPVPQ